MGGVPVIYKCKCMKEEATVNVPFRRADEDIGKWVQGTMGMAIYLDHRTRSPNCRMTAMEYAKLPVPDNAPYLGGEPKVN